MTVGRGKGCRDSEKRERTQEQHGEGKDAETVRKGKGHRNNWEREGYKDSEKRERTQEQLGE